MAKAHKPSSHQPTKKHPVTPTPPTRVSGDPVFGQPQPSPDPTTFKDPVTDASQPDVAGVQPVPQPAASATEPILTLAQIYGTQGATITQTIQTAGQIVFHSLGDTGSVIGPITQSLVADKMVTDFTEANSADVPSFCYHLGDAVYYFGEGEYYYGQFFEPFRNYRDPRQP